MTIGSLYTVTELRDLIAAKDTEIQALRTAFQAFDPTWQTSDPTTESAWSSDWDELQVKYGAARSIGEVVIAESEWNLVPDDVNPAGDVPYHAILQALQATTGVVSPGDFQDLWDRLQAAQAAPIPEPPVPQPSKGSDSDLNLYNNLPANPFSGKSSLEPYLIGGAIAGAALLAAKVLL